MRITAKMLIAKRACSEEVATFTRLWPDGVEVSEETCQQAAAANLNLRWFAEHFLPAPALAAHQQARATALEAYEQAAATAAAAYKQARAPASAAYKQARAPAAAAYQQARATAWAAYHQATATAWAAYQQAAATALWTAIQFGS